MDQPQLQAANEVFLHLERPLIFFDLETTGIDVTNDRIIEICAIKIHPGGSREELYHLINPGIPIPPEATAVHGITSQQVEDKPLFHQLANSLATFFAFCDVAGYNVRRFDVPLLMQEFHRCKLYPIVLTETKVVDAQTIFHKKEPRDLSSAVRFYVKEDHDSAHSAKADVEATIKVLHHQLLAYQDLQPDVSFLHTYAADHEYDIDFSGKFGRDKKGQVIFKFGKYKNKQVNPGDPEHESYFRWIEEQKNTTVEMRMTIKRIRTQHQYQLACKHWLDKLEITLDIGKTLALYNTLVSGQNTGPFQLTRHEKSIHITCSDQPALPLSLPGKDAKHVFLVMLNNYFTEMGGLEHLQATVDG